MRGYFVKCTLLLAALPALAQQPQTAPVQAGPSVQIFAGQSKVFTAPWAVQRMAVTNPKVADVEAVSPTQVLLLGRAIGTTDLILWSAGGEVWQRRVDVTVDLPRFREELARMFPGANLDVTQSQDVLIVTGVLDSQREAARLKEFLTSAERASGMKYANMTRVAAPRPRPSDADLVYIDPAQFRSQLMQLFPDAELEVRQSRDVVIVSGLLRKVEQAQALRRLLEALEASASDQRMRVSPGAGPFAATGPAAEDEDEAARVSGGFKFVDMTSVAGIQQVQLQVKVAEVSRAAIRALGINVLQTGHQDNTFFGASTIGPDGGGALNPISIGPAAGVPAGPELATPNFSPFTFNADVQVSPLVTLFAGFPRAELQFFLQALAENQYLRILAEPNLVALSGEEASFLAGGEFPIPVVQGTTVGGGLSITIEYKEFGVRLRFRPTVLGDGSIRLHVAPEVSDLTDSGAVIIQGFRVPALNTRRAETTLELKSGQTFAMAGLLNSRNEARSSRVPALGDVPVLGALFRSVRYVEGETELVVLVTASLVEPLSLASAPPVPGVLDCVPNDWELYMEGRTLGRGTPCLSQSDAEWLRRLGFHELEGAGAWETYDQSPAPSGAPVERTTPAGASDADKGTFGGLAATKPAEDSAEY